MTRRILLGAAAGLLSAFVCIGVAYVVGVIKIAFDVKEVLPTLLAAVTVLPLMLLFVLLVPSLVMGLLTGATIGVTAHYSSRVYFIGAVVGAFFGLIVLIDVLPIIITPQPGDFTSIITRPIWAGVYSLFLGLLTSRFFSWFR